MPEPPRQAGRGQRSSPDSLVTVGRYSSPVEAHIVRGKLEAHGLFAAVADDQHAAAAWFLVPALGGVRAQTRRGDRAAALEILSQGAVLGGGELAADYDPINLCPDCGSDKVMRPSSWLAGLLGIIGGGVPLLVRTHRGVCHDCGHRWRMSPTAKS